MPALTYEDLDLRFDPLPGAGVQAYRVHLSSATAGQATGAFMPPPQRPGQQQSSNEATRKVEPPSEPPAAPEVSGQALFDALFTTPDVYARFCVAIDGADKDGKGIRIRLHFRSAPELSDLPWESLFWSSRKRLLALSTRTPIVRFMDLPEPPRALSAELPLRALVVISRPSDLSTLDVEAEWLRLQKALSKLKDAGHIRLVRANDSTLPGVARILQDQIFHLFHFIGHGSFDDEAPRGLLAFEAEDGRAHHVEARKLGVLLHEHRSMRLAVLNACEGGRSGAAIDSARYMLDLRDHGQDWSAPALYCRVEDARLFELPTSAGHTWEPIWPPEAEVPYLDAWTRARGEELGLLQEELQLCLERGDDAANIQNAILTKKRAYQRYLEGKLRMFAVRTSRHAPIDAHPLNSVPIFPVGGRSLSEVKNSHKELGDLFKVIRDELMGGTP